MGVELAAIGAISALAGAGVSAYSSIQQGKAQSAAANAQAQQYEQQAKLAEAQAGISQLQGEQEARQRMALLSQDIGTMYANFAGNGVAISSDSVGSALRATTNEGMQDVTTINNNTAMNVWTAVENAKQYRNQAALSRYQASAAKKSGTLSAIGAGISGIGSAISGWSSGFELGNKLQERYNTPSFFK